MTLACKLLSESNCFQLSNSSSTSLLDAAGALEQAEETDGSEDGRVTELIVDSPPSKSF